MEPTARLYQCMLCHQQVIICRKCDRGNIYCAGGCAAQARTRSLKLSGARYQTTFNGRRHNAARQARFRRNHKKIVTHHSSPETPPCAPIQLPENKSEKTESGQQKAASTCHFCKNPVSTWFRNDFLRRRSPKKSTELKACPQAP